MADLRSLSQQRTPLLDYRRQAFASAEARTEKAQPGASTLNVLRQRSVPSTLASFGRFGDGFERGLRSLVDLGSSSRTQRTAEFSSRWSQAFGSERASSTQTQQLQSASFRATGARRSDLSSFGRDGFDGPTRPPVNLSGFTQPPAVPETFSARAGSNVASAFVASLDDLLR